MKVAIVRSSVLAKYNRWDAGFYTGLIATEECDARIVRAQRDVTHATRRLNEAVDEKIEIAARIKRMIDDGEVIPIE